MPDRHDPHSAAQRLPLRGPAFAPGHTARRAELEAQEHWQALLDARLIQTVPPLSPEVLASIAAAERALVGRVRG